MINMLYPPVIGAVPFLLMSICSMCSTGAKEVDEQDDMFILVAPQNAVGNCIIDVSRLIRNIKFIWKSTSIKDLFPMLWS